MLRILFLSVLALSAVGSHVSDGRATAEDAGRQASDFSVRFLQELRSNDRKSNIVISPLGLGTVTAILASSSASTTQDELLRVFGYPAEGLPALEDFLKGEIRSSDRSGPELSTRFSTIFQYPKSIDPADSVRSQLEHDLAVSFVPTPWELRTENPSSDGRPILKFLLDQHFDFRGLWRDEFSPAAEHVFIREDGSRRHIHFMTLESNFSYYEDRTVQAVEIDYRDGEIALLAILPTANSTLDAALAWAGKIGWAALQARLSRRDGRVELPVFGLSYSTDATPILKELGIHRAFDQKTGDFSRIWPHAQPAFLVAATLMSSVKLNERGTEATADMGVEGGVPGGVFGAAPGGPPPPPPPPPFRFIADRPFLICIIQKHDPLPLFLGLVVDPAPPGP